MRPSFTSFHVGLVVSLALSGCAGDDPAEQSVVLQAVGVPPVNSLPSPQTTNEDSPLIFSAAAGNALSVSDADNATLTVQITVTNGTFSLGGSAGVIVSGNGTFSVTATGATTDLIKAIDNSVFRPVADYNGGATLQMNSSDNNGESDLDVLAITVTAFNDPPLNVVPAAVQIATEDVPKAFTFSVTDVDIGGAPVRMTLSSTNASLITLSTTAGLTFTQGDGLDDADLSFSGTLPAVNAALNGLIVTPSPNFIGNSTLVITSSDQGATGAGSPGVDNDVVTISWQAVNDPPVNNVPSAQSMVEDGVLVFNAGNSNTISVGDVDATTALLQVTLSASNGVLTLGNSALVTFTSGDGTADPSMTFNGTLASLNTALAGTSYAPAVNFAGSATLTLLTNDFGNTGSGGAGTDGDTIAVTISAVNDPPVVVVPTAQVTNEDIVRVFSTTNGNPITVSDPDASSLQMTLTATNGMLTLSGTSNLNFLSGDGVGDATMTFSGTIGSLDAALDGVRFIPTPDTYGPASLVVSVTDLGATGAGGALGATQTINLTVVSVNDPPTAVTDTLTVAEDAAATSVAVLANDRILPDVGETLTIAGIGMPLHGVAMINGNQITYQPTANYNGPDSFSYTISDGNGGTATGSVTVTITSVNDAPNATDDTVSVISNSVSNVFAVLGNDTAAPDVNELLTISSVATPLHGTASVVSSGTRISYTPEAGYAGPDTFTYTIGDGNGGSDTAVITVDVVAVITQPVNALPGPQSVVEDSPLFFSSSAGNALSVTDANNTSLTVQVQVTNGTLTLGSVTGLTVTGNSSAALTASGTVTNLNAGLNGARFSPSANYNGPASLTMYSSDTNGETDLDVLTLAVTSFNDAPINTVPTTLQTATEDSPRSFSTISVSDVDLNGAELQLTLTANNGTLITLGSTSGLTFTGGDGTADATMSFVGTLGTVNTALNGLTITASANYIGSSSVIMTSSDQGSTGAGLVGSDTDTVNLSWVAANDPPVNTVPGAQTITEDSVLTFSSMDNTQLTVGDVDVAAANIQVTLSGTSGTMTIGSVSALTFTVGDGSADTTMTFRGTIGAINAALEGTTYRPNANVTGTTTVTMVSNDLGNTGGAAQTDTDTIAVSLTAINDAPVAAAPVAVTTSEDVSRVFSAAQGNAISITDVDATALQVSISGGAGTVTLAVKTGLTFQAGDGTADANMTFTGTPTAINIALNGMTFIPTPQYSGSGTVMIFASDLGATGSGGPLTAETTIAIAILPVNDPPVATADAVTVPEDSSTVTVGVLANDSTLPDTGETLAITAASAPARGTTMILGGGSAVGYTPSANYFGPDSFTYTITDGNGGSATATVSVTVSPVNDPPTAVDDAYTVAEGAASTTFAVRANDTAAPDSGETLAIVAVSAPMHGTAVIAGTGGTTTVGYVPTAGYNGSDSFTYTISDGNGGQATATVSVTITSVNSQPVAVNDTLVVAEDAVASFAVLANDSGLGDAPLTVTVSVAPLHGVAVVQSDLRIQYTPARDYNGADSFRYQVTDQDGQSASAQVTVSVTAVNDVPAAVADAVTLAEDTATPVAVLGNDLGIGDATLIVTVSSAPAHGTTTIAAGVITYTPAADYAGADTLTYQVVDANNEQSSAVVTLTITPVNDAPRPIMDVISARPNETVTVDVLANDIDPDGDAVTITAVTTPAHGSATITVDNHIVYVPISGYTGPDSFTYTIEDPSAATAMSTVVLGIGIDSDADGLLDSDELEVNHTDPANPDTDGDLLSDGVEVKLTNTDPLDDDVDDDGLLDGREDANANGVVDPRETEATDADSDHDGLRDGIERGLAVPQGQDTVAFQADADPGTSTDPLSADTDGGGRADGDEDANANGRIDSGETDPNDPGDDVEPPADGGGCAAGGNGGGALGSLGAVGALLVARRRRRTR